MVEGKRTRQLGGWGNGCGVIDGLVHLASILHAVVRSFDAAALYSGCHRRHFSNRVDWIDTVGMKRLRGGSGQQGDFGLSRFIASLEGLQLHT